VSALMSSFNRVKIQDYQYLIFVVFWNDLSTEFTEKIREHAMTMGGSIEELGFVATGFPNAAYDTAEEVTSKNWPKEIKDRFWTEQDPFILIIGEDFKAFDPNMHDWSIIWLSEYSRHPDQVYKIFGQMIRIMKSNKNLFEHFKINRANAWYRKWVKYLEVKPGIAGVSIDAKGIVEEALGI
jgi:hypothetical protein